MANNQAKKILIFSTAYLPLVGGAEVAVDEITKRLPDWHFDMVTARIQRGLADFEKIGNVNVHRVGFGFSFDKFLLPFIGLLKAASLNRKENYRIIWAIMASQAAITAMFLKTFYGNKKFLLTLQEGDPEKHLKRYVFNIGFLYKLLIKPWHILSFQRADYLTAISNDLKKRALNSGVRVPIEIVPNGVDLEKFSITFGGNSRTPLAARGVLRGGNEKIILTVSRLVKKNGISDLIKAGQYLDFPFKILIIGVGPDENKLRKLTKKLNFQDKILFLGHLSHNDLPKYYSVADVFVRPSLSEGLGNVFLEAMACGTPIIGTPVGGILDFLIDPLINPRQATGLFCQVRNPKSIAEKIEEILTNELLRENLIKNGRKLVEKKYNWDKISQQMEQIYQKLF